MPVKGVVSLCCVVSIALTLSINSAVAGSFETVPANNAANIGASQKKITVATAMTADENAAIHAYNSFNSALIRKHQEQDTSPPSQLASSLNKVAHAFHVAVEAIKDFLDN